MITIPLHTLNGSTSECRMSRNSLLISLILSILSSQKVLITKVWNHCFTQKKKLSKMKEQVMDGTVMELTFATSQIHSRRRVEASITPLPSRFNSCTMTTRSMLHIAILTHTLIAQNFWLDSVNQRRKTESERLLCVKLLLETIVKWQ